MSLKKTPRSTFTLCPAGLWSHAAGVSHEADSIEALWQDYSLLFQGFDDLALARWMAQSLAQLQGNLWRMSHPLVASYRLAAMVGLDRQIWHQRFVNVPPGFCSADCCRAPSVPMVTRDLLEKGLVCVHCGQQMVALDQIKNQQLAEKLSQWAESYAPIHAVAHWGEGQRKSQDQYEHAFEQAAQKSETQLSYLGSTLAPLLLDDFPLVIWEEQDECLQVRPEDIQL